MGRKKKELESVEELFSTTMSILDRSILFLRFYKIR
jgi:hypothetical protein